MAETPPQSSLRAFAAERSLLRISGAEAAHFLQNLLTADIHALKAGQWSAAALLSPQGKIIFDFLIGLAPPAEQNAGDTTDFLIDIAAAQAEAFSRRLSLYKLRAKLEIGAPQNGFAAIFAANRPDLQPLPDLNLPQPDFIFTDSRFPAAMAVRRAYYGGNGADFTPPPAAAQNWDRLRIAAAVPEGGRDFPLGENFPHDVNYDALDGIALRKGCYIGQEVVSRMQHKAAIRKRLLLVEAARNLPPSGTEILADGKVIGRLGTVCGGQGLALIRTDKIPPQNSGEKAQAGGAALHFTAPFYLPPLQCEAASA